MNSEVAIYIDLKFTSPDKDNRMIIPVILEAMEKNTAVKENASYSGTLKFQAIDDLSKCNAYEIGASHVDKFKWLRMVRKVKDSIRGIKPENYIPVLILTTTKSRLINKVDFERSLDGVEEFSSLKTILDKLKISKESFINCYGEKRADWKPFGSSRSISSILIGIKDEILEIYEANKREVVFDWDVIEDELWSVNSIKMEIERRLKLSNELVIVIDPLSMYDPNVSHVLGSEIFQRCLSNKESIIMIFPPFSKPQRYICLKDYIKYKDVLHKYFYEPWLTGKKIARCEAQIGDEHDAKKLLMIGLEDKIKSLSTPSTDSDKFLYGKYETS